MFFSCALCSLRPSPPSPGGRGDHGSRGTSHLCLFLPPAQADTSGGRKSHQLFLLLTSTARGGHDGGPGSNKLQWSCRTPGSWARLGIASARSCSPTGEAEPGRRGTQHPALGNPRFPPGWKYGLGAQDCTWQHRKGLDPGSSPSHPTGPSTPWPQRGASPAHLGPHCILHPSAQQLPGRAGAPQLQLFNALSPQLQVTMLMPTSSPSPPAPVQQPQLCPFLPKTVPKACPLAMPGTENTDPQRLCLKSFISCSRSDGGRLGGSRGAAPGARAGRLGTPLSLPTAPSPVAVVTRGGSRDGLCCLHCDTGARGPDPARGNAVLWPGREGCLAGRGPRATPARAAGRGQGGRGWRMSPPSSEMRGAGGVMGARGQRWHSFPGTHGARAAAWLSDARARREDARNVPRRPSSAELRP